MTAPPLRILFLDVDGVVCCNQNGQLEPFRQRYALYDTTQAVLWFARTGEGRRR